MYIVLCSSSLSVCLQCWHGLPPPLVNDVADHRRVVATFDLAARASAPERRASPRICQPDRLALQRARPLVVEACAALSNSSDITSSWREP